MGGEAPRQFFFGGSSIINEFSKFGPIGSKTGPKYTLLTITSEMFDRSLKFLV